jgi:bifunctional non-homologous end joining protein LigD
VHEVKFDGYRAQGHIDQGTTRIFTRRGFDWSDRFVAIVRALKHLSARSAVLDGEIVALNERGISDYPQLQAALARSESNRLTYYVFDVLYLDGFDLRDVPLIERKSTLRHLLNRSGADGVIRLSEHFEADAADVFKNVCDMQLEGIVCKRRDAPYRSGRHETWLKIKCAKSGTYPIVAFVEKLGAKPRRIASLYVGYRDGTHLLYAGKVATGFTEPVMRSLREQLDPFIRKTSPLSTAVKKPKATWVEPVLEAEVQFSATTAEGRLREAVFKGVRDDLAPISLEPAWSTKPRRSGRGGVPRENILQLLPDAVVPSKAELATYWHRVAKRALKYLARRPLKLVLYRRGTTYYHRGRLPPIPACVRQLRIRKRDGGEGTRLWVDELDGLLGLVEMGTVELHPWNSTVDDLEHPDMLVFDLDPGSAIEYRFVIESALEMRHILRKEGLPSWPKLTGGKGIHLMAPIQPDMTHDQAHEYTKHLAQRLVARDPQRYTISAALPERRGRLFVDYLRNGRGTTAVGTYSPRARENFPIAAPITWLQVEQGIEPDAFTIQRPFDSSLSKP